LEGVDNATAAVLLAEAGVMRALIALVSKLVDRERDAP
jgi:hypothetical protein